MKYYSEMLNKLFSSEADLKAAELVEREKELEAEAAEKRKAEELSVTRKELAKKVEEATKKLDEATEAYTKAQETCKNLIAEADAKVNDIYDEVGKKCKNIMDPAKKTVETCQENKFAALKNFNDKFGPYTTTVTGEKALKEFQNWNTWFEDVFEAIKNKSLF